MKKIENGGIISAKGYLAASVAAEIKYKNRLDMAMIYSETLSVSAATYTLNKVFAAPVKWDKKITNTETPIRSIVINTGVANACTGEAGLKNCEEIAKTVANNLNCKEENVLICSTGVIGADLPMEKIKAGAIKLTKSLSKDDGAGNTAAKAIMTTDTKEKEIAVEVEISGKPVTIGGMCKGAGMIHPNMATMLLFITTDAMIKKSLLQKAFSKIIDDSFNMISVDGDTSTNDTAIILANGMAENDLIEDESKEEYKTFYKALEYVCIELAKKIAGDGEGATALFEANVINAKTKNDAKIIAKSIITSNLTKAAIFGKDANWGRILCAIGYSGADFKEECVDIYFESENGSLKIVENGVATNYSEEVATKILSSSYVKANINLKDGSEKATAWGCDLTFDYVKINADYRS